MLDTLRSQPDPAEVDHDLGVAYIELGQTEQGLDHFRRAADAGHAKSMNNLGVLAVRRGDREQAHQWFRKAALAGDSIGLDNLERLLDEEGTR